MLVFGTYPFDSQWRPAGATLTFVALFFLSTAQTGGARSWFWCGEG